MWKLTVLILISVRFALSINNKYATAVGIALADIINKNSEMHSHRFEVIIHGDDPMLLRFVDNILRYSNYPIKVVKQSIGEPIISNMNRPRIVLESEKVKFSEYSKKCVDLEFYHSYTNAMTYVYYWKNSGIDGYVRIPAPTITKHRMMFLVNNRVGNSIDLYGQLKYQKKNCEMNLKKINEFSIRNLKWKTKTFLKIYTNFNNCIIQLNIFVNRNIMRIYEPENNETDYSMGGIYGDLLNLYAEKHNFRVRVSKTFGQIRRNDDCL